MPAFLFARRGCSGVLVVVLWVSSFLTAQAEPLTFARAQTLAERAAPENVARQAQVESAQRKRSINPTFN